MQVTEFIKKIRAKAQDNDEIKYSDYDILRELNVAYKAFRQICVTDAPEIVSENYKCELPKGENTIVFSSMFANEPDNVDEEEPTYSNYVACNPIKIVELRSKGRILHNASMKNIEDTEAKGYPAKYVLSNFEGDRCLLLYPIPSEDVSIALTLIGETRELTINDSVNVPNDYAYYIVEFVVKALSGAGDVGEFREAIRVKLDSVVPAPCVVEGYY